MKQQRHRKIMELIVASPIFRQEDLLEKLKENGFDVTQATVSRDIRELRLVKTSTGDGSYRYVTSATAGKTAHAPTRFETIFREAVISSDYANNIVLIKCFSGMANAACELFDSMTWEDVVGTLSGDDTFIIIMRDQDAAEKMCEELEKYIS
jgi:Arginine repressor